MKLFTAETGKFQMYIPLNWEYKNPSFYNEQTAPVSFGEYTKMIGAFQISCKPIDENITTIIESNNLEIQNPETSPIKFTEKLVENGGIKNYMWIAAVDNHFFLITYILDIRKSKTRKGKNELRSVKNAISTIKYINPEFRETVIAENRFSLFMASIAASIDLRNKALEKASFIEYVILTANNMDALLRLALILKTQIVNGNSEIDKSLLFQNVSDRPIMERGVYQRTLNNNIISQELFDKLNALYKERNKVVHRYIITDIRTEDVFHIAVKYYELEEEVGAVVSKLEKEQFDTNIGIYGSETPPDRQITGLELKRLQYQIKDKHGRINLKNRNIINLFRNIFSRKLKLNP